MIKMNAPPETIARRYIAPFVRVLVLAAFLVTAVQSSVFAGNLTMTVVNQSGQTITGFYYRSTNDSEWRNAGFGSLPNGGSFYWQINSTTRYVDVGFRLADGVWQERTGIDTDSNGFTLYVSH